VNTLLRLGALALAISATTISAAAQCWCFNDPGAGYVAVPYVVYRVSHRPVQHPTGRSQNEKGHHPVPERHIAKHPKQPQDEEKAPPAGAPPPLPTQSPARGRGSAMPDDNKNRTFVGATRSS
jgi:hypothetical protein